MTVVHRKGKDNVVPDALSRSVAMVQSSTTFCWYDSLKQKVSKQPDKYADFKVENEMLYKFITAKDEPYDCRFEWKLVPHPDEIPNIIQLNHENMHIGFDKTLARIQKRYYWPKMRADIRAYIKTCQTCKEIKPPFVTVTPEMGQMRCAKSPWQIISIDFVGPLPRSRKGNQHMLVISDYFSKWVMIQPVRKLDSSVMCSILKDQWFYRNSVPEIIISDNGTTFTSKEFKALVDRFKIKHWLNSRYHSQANPVERVNRTINTAIRSYVKDDLRSWDTKVPEIELMINTTVHSATGLTPFFIIHGHELSECGSDHSLQKHEQLSAEEKEEKRKQTFGQIYEMVRKNLAKSHENTREQYNLRSRKFAKPFTIGQRVYHKNMKHSNAVEYYNAKYGRQYIPCTVKAKIGTSSYELEDLAGKNIGIWPASHLKPG